MRKDESIMRLAKHKPELIQRFGITNLAFFSSTVRNEARPDSDIDALVSFDGSATSKCYWGVQFYREDLTGGAIDLVTNDGIRPEIRPYIEKELIRI